MRIDTRTLSERIENLEDRIEGLEQDVIKLTAVLRHFADKCDGLETLFTFVPKPKDKAN